MTISEAESKSFILGLSGGFLIAGVFYYTFLNELEAQKKRKEQKAAAQLPVKAAVPEPVKPAEPIAGNIVTPSKCPIRHYAPAFLVVLNLWMAPILMVAYFDSIPIAFGKMFFHVHIQTWELALIQNICLRLVCGLSGMAFVLMYLWSLPSVAKKLSKKYAKRRAKENRDTWTAREVYLDVYLKALEKETAHRAKSSRKVHALDNIGLRPWFQVTLYCLPFLPCLIGGPWIMAALIMALVMDTNGNCKILRWCFQRLLSINSFLTINDEDVQVKLAPPRIGGLAFPIPPVDGCLCGLIKASPKPEETSPGVESAHEFVENYITSLQETNK